MLVSNFSNDELRTMCAGITGWCGAAHLRESIDEPALGTVDVRVWIPLLDQVTRDLRNPILNRPWNR